MFHMIFSSMSQFVLSFAKIQSSALRNLNINNMNFQETTKKLLNLLRDKRATSEH